ncbi:hypothetical protein [Longispora urticae]
MRIVDPAFIGPGTDYWWDVGVEHSRDALSRFSAVEWADLLEGWSAQSEEWQDQLAYLLGEDGAEREVRLLLDMARSPRPEVALRARESLRGLPAGAIRNATLAADLAAAGVSVRADVEGRPQGRTGNAPT